MAKTTTRTRSVKPPKAKSSVSIQKVDDAVLELLRDVHQAEKELAAGKGVAHSKARSQVLARLRR
jgi:hypothetical protein